ncbi:AraC family transcriptional regulator [Paenibacillus sp. GYB003]|uniref:AraC family transcriptional regulator n=1 Tax=Paenibacillus sp. GYB003 TaxID=2994392 RepID=UPI002F96B102
MDRFEVLSVFFGHKTAASVVAAHSHPYWQLEIVTHGGLRCAFAGDGFALEAGDMLLVPPECEHGFVYDKPGVSWITIRFERAEDGESRWGGVIRGRPFTDRLVSSFKIAIPGSADKPYEKAFVGGFLDALLHYIRSDEFRQPADSPGALLGQITDMVLARGGRAVTVSELAEELSYTRSHLSKKFRAIAGESLKAYIDRLRVQKAEELLKYREDSISEIAADLGFGDLFSFSRFVKKHTGASPRELKGK